MFHDSAWCFGVLESFYEMLRACALTLSLMTAAIQVELRSRALLAIGAGDIVVPIFDDEPTSIIAYALSSK